MNWDGTSVYSTTLANFNGRDQEISVVRQDNTQNPVVEQITTMDYDGHGRLKTRHNPEQTNNANTTFNYFIDDSISSVVDARGATTNYSYELVSKVVEIEKSKK
jgi:hypothetical protein